MADAHCRIGRVHFKSGAQLHVLPPVISPEQQTATDVFARLDRYVQVTRDLYERDLAGFVLTPWNHRAQFNCFLITEGNSLSRNTLPEFVAEAVRRENGDVDTRTLLENRGL